MIHENFGRVHIGKDCAIHDTAVIFGPASIGERVQIGPGCVIGNVPEHKTDLPDWDRPVCIGDGSTLFEYVVVARSTIGGRGTFIGSDCYLQRGVHVSHDCLIERDCTLAMGVTLGGHVTVMKEAMLGMGTLVHQWRVIGSYSMCGAGSVVVTDVIPGSLVYGVPAKWKAINLRKTVGLDAQVLSDEASRAVKLMSLKLRGELRSLELAPEDGPATSAAPSE